MQSPISAAGHARPELVPDHSSDCLPKSDAITISCHENEIPSFVGGELERLYGNLYSSLAEFGISGRLKGANTYVVRKGNELVTLLLFQLNKGRVEVLNEVLRIEEEDIERFTNYVFAKFNSAQVISFRAIQTDIRKLPFKHQRFNYLEDFVTDLPASEDELIANIGKNTRKNIRRYYKFLMRDYPAFSFEIFDCETIAEQQVRDIIALNRARMSGKKKVSDLDEKATQRLIDLVRRSGFIGIATIGGRVCGGTICYRTGANYFLMTLAHDPVYNAYRAGMLCCYFTMCECIKRGGKEFHFLWGRYEYKASFLGVRRDLDYLAIYRSRLQFFLNGDLALKAWIKYRMRQAMLWFHHAKEEDTLMSRLGVKVLSGMRSLRGVKDIFFGRRYWGGLKKDA